MLGGAGELFSVEAGHRVDEAAKLMSLHDFSQISITKGGRLVLKRRRQKRRKRIGA